MSSVYEFKQVGEKYLDDLLPLRFLSVHSIDILPMNPSEKNYERQWSGTTDADRSCDSDNMANFIHTTHIHSIQNVLIMK